MTVEVVTDPSSNGVNGNSVSTPPSANPSPPIDMRRITSLADRATEMVAAIRGRLLMPDARKIAPEITGARIAGVCRIAKDSMTDHKSLPQGSAARGVGHRAFSLVEAQAWARSFRSNSMRPPDCSAVTVAVGNFKGGVGKTTTAMVLAQGLSLRGHRVLVIDTDPQASLTTLFGILPETEVRDDMTVGPICRGDSSDISAAVQKTYWDGVDLVPSAPYLFSAEFNLPAMQLKDLSVKFWDVLNASLERARGKYDVIVIDTPPSLSYTAINAFMAADGIVIPMPPSALDFASAAQFWGCLQTSAKVSTPNQQVERHSIFCTSCSRASINRMRRLVLCASGFERPTVTLFFPSKFLRRR